MTRRPNRLGRVRKSSAALSVLALSALALTGCSAAPSVAGASCERDSSSNLADAVDVTGDIGAAQIDFAAPLRTDGAEYADLIVGDGTAVTTDNQTSIVAIEPKEGDRLLGDIAMRGAMEAITAYTVILKILIRQPIDISFRLQSLVKAGIKYRNLGLVGK